MSQRPLAALLAVPLLLALAMAALVVPLPYVIYSPAYTVNVLGRSDGKDVIQVSGHRSYDDPGQLRMTVVYVTQPDGRVSLFDAMDAWLDDEKSIYPYDAVYRPDETQAQSQQEGAAQMVSAKDAAVAMALVELGYNVERITVSQVEPGAPADGALRVGDRILRVGGTAVRTTDDISRTIQAAAPDAAVRFVVRRAGGRRSVDVVPRDIDGQRRVGIQLDVGVDLPFTVDINIDSGIGGPSAGLMFALATYDRLTPGSLTDGAAVAGTGTLDLSGRVGSIGGIQQKIVAARNEGIPLFLVPADNCTDAVQAPNGSVRLVKVSTLDDALASIQTWTSDHDAELPACAGAPS
ncbi:MAG: PDZ domain-containing protein [Nocardioides sp.]